MIRNRAFWRKIIVYIIYCISCGLLQVTLPDTLSVLGGRPDLTLILAVLAGYMFGAADGFASGLAAGLMRDLLAGRTLGLGMLLLMYAGLGASVLLRRFFRRNMLFGVIQVVIFTVIYTVMIVIITYLIPLQSETVYSFARLAEQTLTRLPGQIIINAIAAVPLILLLAFLGPYRRSKRGDDPDDGIVGDSLWRVA